MVSSLIALVILCVATANAALTISNTLGSNMVLQRSPAAANIWGWGTPSTTVTIVVQGPAPQQQTGTVGSDGAWLIALTPTAAGGPYTILVSGSDGSKLAPLQNILFGDVWICSGQSNMQFTVACGFNASEEIQAANNYPEIRVMTVGTSHYSSTPLQQLNTTFQPWSVASNVSIGVGEWSAFSAVCWFTGRNLYDRYKVPLGLISTNWGGTVIQAWSSPAALKVCNVTTSGSNNEANSVLYNAMIVPFQNQPIKGALWYQGEQNAGQAQLYSCMFPAMISDWRNTWAAGPVKDFPFLFVQLAPCAAGSSTAWPDERQAQLSPFLTLPNVGYATAVDLGDPTSPFGNVHPRDKQDVGVRLCNAARNIAYGETSVVWQGPTFKSVVFGSGTNSVSATVTFTLYGVQVLNFQNRTCPTNESIPAADCATWQIQLSNGNWYPAEQTSMTPTAVSVEMVNPAGTTAIGVSYAYASWPVTTLFSGEGLPVVPFKYPNTIVPY